MNKIMLLLLCITILANPILSCGMVTHTEISHRAMHNFEGISKDTGKDYKKLILENASFFMAGSPFPDWGYACKYGDTAEATHWPPFIHEYLKYVKENYPNDVVRQNELYSFIFGVESHGISDVIWHWGDIVKGTDDQGYLHSMGHMASNCNDNWNNCHGPGDTGGDMYLTNRGGLRWFSDYWTAPIDDLNNIYKRIGVPTSRTVMTECVLMMFIGARLEGLVSIVELAKSERTAAFLSDDLDLWFHGGLDDMSMGVVWQWENLIKLIENENPHKKELYMQRRNKLMKLKKEGRQERKKIMKEVLSEENVEKFKVLMGAKAVDNKKSKNNKSNMDNTEVNNKLRFLQKQHIVEEDSQNCIHDDETSCTGDVHFSLDEFKLNDNKLHILEIICETIFPNGEFKDRILNDFKILEKNQFNHFEEIEKLKNIDNLSNTKPKLTAVQKLNNITPFSYFGKSITYGDFNGDGILEVAIGAPGFGKLQSGAVYMGPFKNLSNGTKFLDLDPTDEPLLQGESEFSRFGFSLTTVDLNHDGIDDLVVSAPSYGKNGPSPSIEDYYPKSYQGRIYVFYGIKGKGINKNSKPDLIIEPKLKDNTTKFFNLGYKLNSGDCDGDGYADLLIGSPYSQQGGDKEGHVGIFTNINKNSTSLNIFNIEDADFTMSGSNNYEEFGYSLMCQNKTVFIGAPGYRSANKDHHATGGVFAFDFENKTQKFFIFSDKQQSRYGASMDIQDDMIAIGAPSYSVIDNSFNFHNGVVFLYSINSLINDSSPINYLNNLKLKIFTETHRARFGKTVKFFNDKIYIGAPMISYDINRVENGKIYVFEKIFEKSGQLKTDQCDKEIDNIEIGARLGDSLIHALNTNYLFVTAPYTIKDEFCGKVFVIKNDI